MATRQEIIVGYTLAIWTYRATDHIWHACHIAQEIHPVTGAPLLCLDKGKTTLENPWVGTQNILRPYTLGELQKEVDNALRPIDGYKNQIDPYVAKADGKLIDNALNYYKLTLTSIQSDLSLSKNTKTSIESDKQLPVNKESLAIIGSNRLPPSFSIDDSVNPDTLSMPRDVFLLNSAHDVIDALSYELQGINHATGDIEVNSSAILRQLVVARCKTAEIELEGARSAGASTIACAPVKSAMEYVRNNLDVLPFSELGTYIDNNLEKLPVVKRHWAL